MAVVDVPAHAGAHLLPGTVPGLLHVYCVGPGPATFGISIYNAPPPYTWHDLAAGHFLTFQVDNLAVWVQNNGPSRIQLLYDTVFAGQSVEQAEGVRPHRAEKT